MKAKLQCGCGQIFIVDDRFFGKKIKCPKCSRAVLVPMPKGVKTASPAPKAEEPVRPVPVPPKPGAAPKPSGAAKEAPKPEEPPAPEPAEEPTQAEPEPEEELPKGTLKAKVGDMEFEFEDPTESTVSPTDILIPPPDLAIPAEMGDETQPPAAAAAPAAPAPAPAASTEAPAESGAAEKPVDFDPTKANQCPHCQQELPPGAVLCVNCGLDLRTGRKLRKATVEEDNGPSYEPPEEGKCCLCEAEGVQVVQVPRAEFVASKRLMKEVRKTVDSKSPSEQELQTALSVRIGGGETRPVCEKCARKYKVGPKKFADLIEEEEEPEGQQAEAGGAAEKASGVKKLTGIMAKLKKKK